MIRQLAIFGGLTVIATVVWAGIWNAMLLSDIARVKATIKFYNEASQAITPYITLKADKIEAAGFPFHFRVRIKGLALSLPFRGETNTISTKELLLEPLDKKQGFYRVILPTPIEALYGQEGKPSEEYTVTIDPIPEISLSAQRDAKCGTPFGRGPCVFVRPNTALITYNVIMPKTLMLHASLNGETRDIRFDFPLSIPITDQIPAALDRPLDLFVAMLREALVFKTK